MDLMNSVVSDSYGFFGMKTLPILVVERFAADYRRPLLMTERSIRSRIFLTATEVKPIFYTVNLNFKSTSEIWSSITIWRET
jgi:hypothetical protein